MVTIANSNLKPTNRDIKIVKDPGRHMFGWTKNFRRIQENFYDEEVRIRRFVDAEDFITLNGYRKVFVMTETDLGWQIPKEWFVDKLEDADLVFVADQRLSRLPCFEIINEIKRLTANADGYITFNRHYLNIDNRKIDLELPDDYIQAITSWMKQSLPEYVVTDLSRNYLDNGQQFTFALGDRQYSVVKR